MKLKIKKTQQNKPPEVSVQDVPFAVSNSTFISEKKKKKKGGTDIDCNVLRHQTKMRISVFDLEYRIYFHC